MLPQGQQFFDESQQRSFEKGAATAEAKAILRVLERRGLAVSDEQRKRVLSCTELSVLETWLDKAVTATSTEELFA